MSEFGEDWSDGDWEYVLSKIGQRQCVPFLGAGVNTGILPLGADLAKKLAAKDPVYPLSDTSDLIKVSQYRALRFGRGYVKREVVEIIEENAVNPGLTHSNLARLRFPVYITTNYDSLLSDAIGTPRATDIVCKWNSRIAAPPSFPQSGPTRGNPIVFYFHGSKKDVESLVLTEDDYLDFLCAMSQNSQLIPQVITDTIRKSTVLFIGYRLADWNLRIVFRQLADYEIRGIAVFPPPSNTDPSKLQIQKYLKDFFAALNITICWATAEKFLDELVVRYEARSGRRQ